MSIEALAVMTLRNVSLTFNSRGRAPLTVLNDVSADIFAGEVITIIGANGAGKSSLLRTMAGELQPASGKICFANKALSQWNLRELACQMAVLPQQTILSFPFSVKEVVGLGCIPHASGAAQDYKIIAAAMDAMDVTHLADASYLTLSGGEQQRVHLARVLTQLGELTEKPALARVLLLDEPVAGLDIQHQSLLGDAIKSVAQQGVSVIQVLHDLNLALRFSDRCFALSEGCLLASGPVDEVIQPSVLQEVFDVEMQLLEDDQGQQWVVRKSL